MEYNGYTPEKLLEFSKEISDIYERGEIRAPIHLSDGSEEELIKFFKDQEITQDTWIFSQWRSHFHWLLSGRDPEELKTQILEGRSMHVYGHKFITSSIVAGIAPIALGIAYALKKSRSKEKVYCFLGCMSMSTGLAQECIRYASGHNLPIVFVGEINGLSVRANTLDCWGRDKGKVVYTYKYERKKPHAGNGQYVMF